MKAGWETKKLGELLDIQNGYAFDSKAFSPDGKMPLIRIRDLREGVDTETRYTGDYDQKYVVEAGDLLIGMDGEFGCHEWKGKPALLNQRVCRLQNFKTTLLPRFLLYGINSHLKDIEDVTGFTTVKHLSSKQVLDIDFLTPPLPEQQRIVTILDQAFEGIATATTNAEKNLANARELFESELQAVFTSTGDGCLTKSLNEVCLIKPPKSEVKDNLDSSDLVSFIPMESLGINQKYFDASRVKTLKEVAGSYTYFADGDVLLAKITPCFENGKLGVARNLKNGVGFGSSEYIVFRAGPALYNEYLYYFLFRKSFIEDGAARMTGAVGHKRVAKEFIENTLITLPPFAEQKAIVNRLDELFTETKKLEVIYQQKLIALDELKKSLLHRSFAGELTHV